MTIGGSAVVNLQGNVLINNNAGNAFGSLNSTLNMQGGMVTQGGSNFVVDDAQGTATYNQTGGTYVCESTNGAWIGNSTAADSGIMTVSGGAFVETAGLMRVGATSAGTLSVGGGPGPAAVSCHRLFANNGARNRRRLPADRRDTPRGQIDQPLNEGSGTLNFDGGTLLASGSNASFMFGLTAANVEELGGVVNNGGFAITIAQDLQSGGVNPVDGGLLFQGTGSTT